ncbi:oxidoreductase [Adlercreutzia sp. ZJ304]|uniref:oxidoreductase n=1 Tax=Adlercreutzia sp. ZJ304 TaxID=2709791 RepID=UPI0013EB6BBD|nr:oxidoreductase [Adlercreutzia sp. ZJ304]
MHQNALLVNYDYCTGCKSCEIACRNELGLSADQWGIKVTEVGPFQIDNEKWEWDYVAVPTQLCTLCKNRVAEGAKPACALHCLASVIEYGPAEDLVKRVKDRGLKKSAIYLI